MLALGLLGQILAAGQGSAAAAVSAWMGDAPHKDILLGAVYKNFGVGCTRNDAAKYHVYWAVDLGDGS